MGLTAVASITNGLWLYGIHKMYQRVGLSWLMVQGILYLLGPVIYVASFETLQTTDSELMINS